MILAVLFGWMVGIQTIDHYYQLEGYHPKQDQEVDPTEYQNKILIVVLVFIDLLLILAFAGAIYMCRREQRQRSGEENMLLDTNGESNGI